MTFWHVAVIILVLDTGEALSITFPAKSAMSCGEMLPGRVLAAQIDHPESYGMCRPTQLPSGVTVRPQARSGATE